MLESIPSPTLDSFKIIFSTLSTDNSDGSRISRKYLEDYIRSKILRIDELQQGSTESALDYESVKDSLEAISILLKLQKCNIQATISSDEVKGWIIRLRLLMDSANIAIERKKVIVAQCEALDHRRSLENDGEHPLQSGQGHKLSDNIVNLHIDPDNIAKNRLALANMEKYLDLSTALVAVFTSLKEQVGLMTDRAELTEDSGGKGNIQPRYFTIEDIVKHLCSNIRNDVSPNQLTIE